MASTVESTSLSRYRPVVLTLCGTVAAFSIWQIYKASQLPPGPGLRRRPAVRRPRRRHGSRSNSPSPVSASGRVPPPDDGSDEIETVAETHISGTGPMLDGGPAGVHSELTELLYHIGENRAREAGYIHRGVTCDSCSTAPIRGIRWHCMQCEDFDLCSDCEAQGQHDRTHIFGKIKIPAPSLVGSLKLSQPVIYTGNPGNMPPSLSAHMRRKLHEDTTLELEVLDALYDQFSCLTTVHNWQDDPSAIGSGIDRAGFDKGFFASYLNTPKHNLVYDRYFNFFDANKDGIIDFTEYTTAIAIHTNQKGRNAKLRAVFDGYDVDGDGFVSRKDILRMLRPYFTLQRLIVQDALEHEEGLSLKLMQDHLASAQPLGAVFKTSFYHRGDADRVPNAKGAGEESDPALSAPILSDDRQDQEGNRWDLITNQKHGYASEAKWRWQKRRFYSDEEEGMPPPPGWDPTGEPGEGSERIVTGDGPGMGKASEESHSGSPCSPISSRVRFKDVASHDAGVPMGLPHPFPLEDASLGGYEIPPEEQDISMDVLFQVTQQALNEVLDGIFKEAETQAEMVIETRSERAKWADKIKEHSEKQKAEDMARNDPLLAVAAMTVRQQRNAVANGRPTPPTPPAVSGPRPIGYSARVDGAHDAVGEVADSLSRLPTSHVGDRITAVQRQVEDSSLEQLLSDSGYSVGSSHILANPNNPESGVPSRSNALTHDRPETPDSAHLSRMPTYTDAPEIEEISGSGTLPHLRPSTPELERLESRARNALHRASSESMPLTRAPFVRELHPILHMPKESRLEFEPDHLRLQFYQQFNACEEEIRARGGEGRISWEQFRFALTEGNYDGKCGFLEDWIRIGQI